jgi:predicted ribosome quality control (RQC) complex YloA/Tae2 family protein
MKIKLDVTKSLESNAEVYFEKAKKAKKKIAGTEEAIEKLKKKLEDLKKQEVVEKKKAEKIERKKEWYEKFRWFFSSEGFLCIGGRDATSNEIVIKKHTDKDDLVLHADVAGSPFFVIKTEGKKIGESTMEEVAQATAVYSRAWKAGISTIEVFMINPEQVSKEAKAGEYMAKGAFMIYGKKLKHFNPDLRLAVGIKDGVIIGGAVNAVKKNADRFVIVVQGKGKTAAAAKKIQKKLKGGDLDDIIRMLPAGGCEISK